MPDARVIATTEQRYSAIVASMQRAVQSGVPQFAGCLVDEDGIHDIWISTCQTRNTG